jgi:dTMP kinase
MKGIFITFEGVEGGGKSTQIRLLKEYLEAQGYTVCMTREPGGDRVAEGVRSLLLSEEMNSRTELLLFLAARAQNVALVVRPLLEAGHIVLCDRFTDSSLAYQGYARGLGREVVANLNKFATNDLTPNLTFLLDLPPEIGLERQKEKNRMEAESLTFHQKVREGFLAEAERSPKRFRIIDATQEVSVIHEAVTQHVESLLTQQE